MLFDYIICHYGEIGLKGRNRNFFEDKLVENIKKGLTKDMPQSFEFVKRISGRILVKLNEKGIKKQKEIEQVLKNIFGIVYFSFALNIKQEIKEMEKTCLNLLKIEKFKTFRVLTQRSEKKFPLTSPEVNKKVGAYIVKDLKKKVNLKEADITCFIEIVEKFCFIYLEKIKGPGGLPLGVSGRAAVLLSGGIDSPVASFYTMKRGVELVFIHFHSYPNTSKASIEKTKELVKTLNKFQFKSKLILVPFLDIQKEILLNTPDKLRVILYRRLMFRIAEELSIKEKALALVTGESIGQVASQTLENIKAIEEVTKIPILRPVIGFDKEEIIEKAKEINTFEISTLPHEDCCSLFLPKRPETRARLEEVGQVEKQLKVKDLIEKAVKNIKIEII